LWDSSGLTPNHPGPDQRWFEIDLGNVFEIDYFRIQNTHNRNYNDRGTLDFRISVSTTGTPGSYVTILDDVLNSVIGTGNDIPWQIFDITATSARYIRFDVDAYTSMGGGLNELQAYGQPVPIPGAVWLLGSGLIGLVGLRRRFKG